MATRGMGAKATNFCQDGAWDFFKINEKIVWGGVDANLQRSRGVAENFSFIPPLFNPGHTPEYDSHTVSQ